MRKTDAIVLIAICGLLVLNAGAISLGGYSRAKILMCTTNLGKMGQAMAVYSTDYDGKLPTLEYYKSSSGGVFTPAIETASLVNKRGTGTPDSIYFFWRHHGCLYGGGYIDDGQDFYCPAVKGWRYDYINNVGTGSNGLTSWANLTCSWNQGARCRGYLYWPLSEVMATASSISAISSSGARSNYGIGFPLSATMASDLLMTRPMIADNKFHGNSQLRWRLNTLYPDGRVVMQSQPKKNGHGMYSKNEYYQFPSDVYTYLGFVDPEEAALNLPAGVTPSEFMYALEP